MLMFLTGDFDSLFAPKETSCRKIYRTTSTIPSDPVAEVPWVPETVRVQIGLLTAMVHFARSKPYNVQLAESIWKLA